MRLLADKAMYQPGEEAVFSVCDVPQTTARFHLHVQHLQEQVLEKTVPADSAEISLTLPDIRNRGYLLILHALDPDGQVLACAMTGVDCSDSWLKFPRYGYLWDYGEKVDAVSKIRELQNYHINALQFYDWQYRHHIPVSPDRASWLDWSGREISGNTVLRCLQAAHESGMAGLAYNMIYAANKSYLTDGSGVNPAWRLLRENGADFTCDMDASRGPVGILQYFNPLNPAWQKYIFAREADVFSAFPFDGWHGDTIGEMGPMQTPDGSPLGYDPDGKAIRLVKDTYTQFLNAAKQALGDRYLVFNPVGAQGLEKVCVSRVDALYAEFWPWDCDDRGLPFSDYYSIHRAILRASVQSGGKSLIVAGYINYRSPESYFNPPAVRLMDSMVFASGGARIELGNGNRMLSSEYFPDDSRKTMDADLQKAVQRIYDFSVAYENLLRDGQQPLDASLRIQGVPVSTDGRSDTVWCFAKTDELHEIYHFINLTGTDNLWQDSEQTKKAPRCLHHPEVTIHTAFHVKEVFLASPDFEDLTPRRLPFRPGTDPQGDYVTFALPFLSYWDMVFLR